MIHFWKDSRWRAALVSAGLFGLGAIGGAAADRAWLVGTPSLSLPGPLTGRGLARALDLNATERVRVEALLDTLRPAISRAAFQGGDSLRWAARLAQQRLEAALPPDRRAQFENWMTDHHRRMMDRMGPGATMGPGWEGAGGSGGMMGPGGRGRMGPSGGGMMGPGRGMMR
ncbi:MAG: hypothetical protein HY700_08905 [Gemmatimonadetes bacterium]|nr:hypothetical protein [Gemmatimonadota bacterium]